MGVKRLRQQGVTLIELIIAIVVLGIAVVGVLTALGRTTLFQVDPMLRAQSLALAQSFMDEVTAKPFYAPDDDPRFDEDATVAVDPCNNMPDLDDLSGSDRVELLDAVCAYDGYNADTHEGGIVTPEGTSIPGLGAYNVMITVSSDNLEKPFDQVPGNCILRIEVSVDDPTGSTTRLHGYRTSSWEDCA